MKQSYLVKAWSNKTYQYESFYIRAKSQTEAYQRAFRLCQYKTVEFNQLSHIETLCPYTKTWR